MLATRISSINEITNPCEILGADVSNQALAINPEPGASVLYNASDPAYSKWVEFFPALHPDAIAAAEPYNAKLAHIHSHYMYGHNTVMLS